MKCKVCGKGRPRLFVTGSLPGAYCDADCYAVEARKELEEFLTNSGMRETKDDTTN